MKNCPLLPIRMFQPPWPTGAQQKPARSKWQTEIRELREGRGSMFQTKAHSQRICPSKWKRLWELWFAPAKADRPARIVQGLRGRGAVLKDELSEHSRPWRNLAQKGCAWDIAFPPAPHVTSSPGRPGPAPLAATDPGFLSLAGG